MNTFQAKKRAEAPKWFVVDLAGKTLGRAATKIADVLRGKHTPKYTPNVDLGDFVIAVNASKVRITGKKAESKVYYRHTGYPGGIREEAYLDLIDENPGKIIEEAVKGMLPKSILGRNALGKLKVYAGAEHPHKAQQPQELTV